MGMCFEDHDQVAIDLKKELLERVARWLDLRAAHRVGPARPEDIAVADMLRSGDWCTEAAELEKCRS